MPKFFIRSKQTQRAGSIRKHQWDGQFQTFPCLRKNSDEGCDTKNWISLSTGSRKEGKHYRKTIALSKKEKSRRVKVRTRTTCASDDRQTISSAATVPYYVWDRYTHTHTALVLKMISESHEFNPTFIFHLDSDNIARWHGQFLFSALFRQHVRNDTNYWTCANHSI